MSRKTGIAAIVLALIAVVLSAASLYIVNKPAEVTEEKAEKDIQYVLYLGTNDKDTNEPVCSHEEAMEKAKKILIDRFGGYTIQEANGGWKDGDIDYEEYTLVIYLSDTSLDAVHAAAKEMISTFNQNSVLIHANETSTEFYSGN